MEAEVGRGVREGVREEGRATSYSLNGRNKEARTLPNQGDSSRHFEKKICFQRGASSATIATARTTPPA